jgi:hypothetical protein
LDVNWQEFPHDKESTYYYYGKNKNENKNNYMIVKEKADSTEYFSKHDRKERGMSRKRICQRINCRGEKAGLSL